MGGKERRGKDVGTRPERDLQIEVSEVTNTHRTTYPAEKTRERSQTHITKTNLPPKCANHTGTIDQMVDVTHAH